jgi:CheY-like chemotaxis protein
MRKRILIVSASAQSRNAAEHTLRQEGFEVVSVDTHQRAEGILGVSEFDLVLVGYGVSDDAGGFYFDHWLKDPSYQQRKFLILSDTDTPPIGIPQELVIPHQAAPEILVSVVSRKVGAAAPDKQLFTGGGSDDVDSVLDAALGLDQIEVHSSETMGSDTSQVLNTQKKENLVGYEADVTNVSTTHSNVTDTAKIDLALAINKGVAPKAENPNLPADEQLNLASHKFAADQAPPSQPAGQPSQPSQPSRPDQPDEFMEMMRADLSTAGAPSADPAGANQPGADSVFEWDQNPANTAEVSQVFSQQLAREIAERVSAKLVSQLNSDKFIQLIQAEIQNYLKNKS